MKYLLFALSVILSQNVMAGCKNFTPEQFAILQTAYGYGKNYDLTPKANLGFVLVVNEVVLDNNMMLYVD